MPSPDLVLSSELEFCRPTPRGDAVQFRVWAPFVKKVELVLGHPSAPVSMVPDERGYFEAELQGVSGGLRYGYSLDGGPARPDPCTVFQPDGVHGLSELYFPSDFEWNYGCIDIEQGDLIIYEMHIGTFTKEGTFDEAISRLDDLVDLGVNAVEVLPVAQFPGRRNWGYDGVQPFATQNSYGGPEAFQRFIDAAHGKGLAVFLDVVFNHLGPEGNYLNEFGRYFNPKIRTPWGAGFNFDGVDAAPVRQWVMGCVWQWIHDFRLDGLRLDAVHAIADSSDTHVLGDLNRIAEEAAAARGGKCTMIAESLLNDDIMVTPRNEGGHGFDAEWNEDFHHAVSAWATGERDGKYVDYGDRDAIANVFRDTFHLAGRYSEFYQQEWGSSVHGKPGDRFVISLQNHDHVGNRARGERLASLVGEPQLRLSACLTLLAPYVPMLYMGEEYGETNPFLFFCEFGDPQLIEAVRKGRKRDYGLKGEIPDPQAEDTFLRSRLSWSWKDGMSARIRSLYRELIQLRKSLPALTEYRNKDVFLLDDDESSVLVLNRGAGDGLCCVFNLGETETRFPDMIRFGNAIWRSSEETADSLAPYETIVFENFK